MTGEPHISQQVPFLQFLFFVQSIKKLAIVESRKAIPKGIETKVLTNSRRRCCICFCLDNDFGEKDGQIAHLNHDRADSRYENLAYLCLFHHNRYDSRTSQSKNFTINEVKEYRNRLYEVIVQNDAKLRFARINRYQRNSPLLRFSTQIPFNSNLPFGGIRLSDKDPNDYENPSQTYLSVYFRDTPITNANIQTDNRKWLLVDTILASGLFITIGVQAENEKEANEFVSILRGKQVQKDSIELRGPKLTDDRNDPQDSFFVIRGRDRDTNRLGIAVYSPTSAISIHLAVTNEEMVSLAEYLEASGFV